MRNLQKAIGGKRKVSLDIYRKIAKYGPDHEAHSRKYGWLYQDCFSNGTYQFLMFSVILRNPRELSKSVRYHRFHKE